jgi:hypothetical protein
MKAEGRSVAFNLPESPNEPRANEKVNSRTYGSSFNHPFASSIKSSQAMNEVSSKLEQSQLRRGRLMVVTSALLWSTSGAFVKSPPLAAIPQDARGPLLACFRALSAAVVLALFVRPRYIRWRPMLVPFVICFASMNLLYVTAMTRTTAAAAVFLQYTGTGWAFLASALFLREHIGRRNLVALAFAMVGIWWIVAGDSQWRRVRRRHRLPENTSRRGFGLARRPLPRDRWPCLIAKRPDRALVIQPAAMDADRAIGRVADGLALCDLRPLSSLRFNPGSRVADSD